MSQPIQIEKLYNPPFQQTCSYAICLSYIHPPGIPSSSPKGFRFMVGNECPPLHVLGGEFSWKPELDLMSDKPVLLGKPPSVGWIIQCISIKSLVVFQGTKVDLICLLIEAILTSRTQ